MVIILYFSSNGGQNRVKGSGLTPRKHSLIGGIYREFTWILLGGPHRVLYNGYYLEEQAQMSLTELAEQTPAPETEAVTMVSRWGKFL